jgi:hypothetical protein
MMQFSDPLREIQEQESSVRLQAILSQIKLSNRHPWISNCQECFNKIVYVL